MSAAEGRQQVERTGARGASGPAPALRIGQLAARTGRSVHTIRWYEAQGLIPGVMRDSAGRRVYSQRHLSWLELVDRLRLTGMSIAQMRAYTTLFKQGRSTLKQQQQLLTAHRERVEATLAEWTRALRLLDRKILFYDEWLSTGRRPGAEPETAAKPSSGRRKR